MNQEGPPSSIHPSSVGRSVSNVAEVTVATDAAVAELAGGGLDRGGLALLDRVDELLRRLLHLRRVFPPLPGALAALRLGWRVVSRHLGHGEADVAHLDERGTLGLELHRRQGALAQSADLPFDAVVLALGREAQAPP